MTKQQKFFGLIALVVLTLGSVAAAPTPAQPNVTITLVDGLPATMQVGETYTVVVEVVSDTPFIFATLMPDMYYPGRYVVANGSTRVGQSTSATLEMTFTAKASTAELPEGVAPVAVVAGVRFAGGTMVSVERFDFNVVVP